MTLPRAIPAVLFTLSLAAAQASSAQTLTEIWRTPGFKTPESAYPLPDGSGIVVSNIGAFGPDGGTDGYLSLLGPDGAVVTEQWITGLTDPKGMAAIDGKLYVSDLGLHVIDLATAALEQTIPLPDATFPNDVAAGPDGTVYVTDFLGGGLYAVKDNAASWLVEPGGLPLPNGVIWSGDGLIVGSFGDVLNPDFSVNTLGGLLALDPATGTITPVPGTEATASVDGIADLGGIIVYDDNPTGRIFAVTDAGVSEIATTASGAADLGAMGTTVVIPFLNSGEVAAYTYE